MDAAMGTETVKRDRTARLLRIQLLLGQYPEGLDVKTIARLCSTHMRTVYRDLKALETELNVPIWEDGKKRGIVEGYFLPPITFTLTEAVTVFSCARLLYNHLRVCNPGMISMFTQLSSIVPQPLRKQIQTTVNHIEKLPRNEKRLNNFNKLINAWLSQHAVRFNYQEHPNEAPIEVTVNPYFIEANTTKHYNYIIGYSHQKKAISTFKINRIVGDIVLDEFTSFEIPSNFDVDDYRDAEWGTCDSEKTETIKLHFSPGISKDVTETAWHSSQKIESQSDGSIIMIVKAKDCIEFRNWILSYGRDVEVLEPPELRQQMLDYIQSLANAYINKQQKETNPANNILLSNKKASTNLTKDRRMLGENQIRSIRENVLAKGMSIRSVAMQMGVSRNTIAKYIKSPQPIYAVKYSKQKTKPVLEKIIPRINELLRQHEEKSAAKQLSGSKIYRKLIEEGHRVGITTIRNYLRESKTSIKT
jgi:predicted DNA-binding transcriptional regulator YafY/transposase